MKRISIVALLLTLLLSSTTALALADDSPWMGSGHGYLGSGTAVAENANGFGSGLAVEDDGTGWMGSGN